MSPTCNKGTYKVWCPSMDEHEEDAKTILTFDAQEAAEEWAERDDCESADYTIVGGKQADVVVLDVETGERTEWSVSGETQAVYYARQREKRP